MAAHLAKQGFAPKLVSKIGSDQLGKDLLDFSTSKGVSTQYLQSEANHPTGIVHVQIGENGDASYNIVYPSAWDFIDVPSDFNESSYLLVFGSLASRNEHSRNTLFYLLDRAEQSLFDVNFRAPHYTKDLIELLLGKSNMVKLNEDEIEIIGQWLNMNNASLEEIALKLLDTYHIEQLIITLGAKGAMVCSDGKFYRHNGFKVDVLDTVGSGDSFLAAYLGNLLQSHSIDHCLEMACATGAYIATQQGAFPDYKPEDVRSIMM